MKFLEFLYNSIIGRAILKIFTKTWFSKLVGKFLDSPCSKFLIKGFVKRNNIDLNEYENVDYACFNDCFTRKMKGNIRTIEDGLVSPCDSFLRAIKISDGTLFEVKHSFYSVEDLVKDKKLTEKYLGGTCLIFRLSTEHYHRYIFPSSGIKGKNTFIKGKLHTVQPFAQRRYPVFVENCREYTTLHTKEFGDILQMEVGALLVGKIVNYMQEGNFSKGDEKGMFLYGGSTIILLIEKDRATIPELYFDHEVEVKMGQKIGKQNSI